MKSLHFINFFILFPNVLCLDDKLVTENIKMVDSLKSGLINFEKVKRDAVTEVQNDIKKLDESKAANLLNMYNFFQDPTVTKLIRGELEENSLEKKRYLQRKRRQNSKKATGNKSRMFLKLCLKGAREERMVKRLCKRMAILGDLAAEEDDESAANIQTLLTHLYEAEAKVQLEANEVVRYQQIASAAQHSLEEATNKVRVLSAELQAEQNATQILAENAHNVQIQLANHDQLLFEARQKVSQLSNEMVELEENLAGSAIADITATGSIEKTEKTEKPEKTEKTEMTDRTENNEDEKPQMQCFGLNCI